MALGDFDMVKIGDVPPQPWLAALSKIDPETWDEMDYRQSRTRVGGGPGIHSATQSLPVLWNMPPEFNRVRPQHQIKLHRGQLFHRPLHQLRHACHHTYGRGWLLRCLVVRLPAGEEIPRHRDNGYSFEVSHRIHVPLISDPAVRFKVGETEVHMAEGEVWEINNFRYHAVRNDSLVNRLHVIADWHTPSFASVDYNDPPVPLEVAQ